MAPSAMWPPERDPVPLVLEVCVSGVTPVDGWPSETPWGGPVVGVVLVDVGTVPVVVLPVGVVVVGVVGAPGVGIPVAGGAPGVVAVGG